jgi:hypothetical protein
MEHAKNSIIESGGKSLIIQSDPDAVIFYRAAGGKLIGEQDSLSIPDRKLPLFSIELSSSSRAAQV